MPGFSIRKVQWGPPPYLAPTAPAIFYTAQSKHRSVNNHTVSRLGRIQGTVQTSESEAFIPAFLTHLKSHRKDVHPLAPPPVPSVHHLPYLYSRLVHKYKFNRAIFFKLPKLED